MAALVRRVIEPCSVKGGKIDSVLCACYEAPQREHYSYKPGLNMHLMLALLMYYKVAVVLLMCCETKVISVLLLEHLDQMTMLSRRPVLVKTDLASKTGKNKS